MTDPTPSSPHSPASASPLAPQGAVPDARADAATGAGVGVAALAGAGTGAAAEVGPGAGAGAPAAAGTTSLLQRLLPPWLGALALAVALLALGWAWNTAQRLERAGQEMAGRAADNRAEAATAREIASAADAQVRDLAARLGVAELRLAEVTVQRDQIEALLRDVARTRDDSLAQELEASIRFAQQQSQIVGSVQPLLAALQAAQQRVERTAQPRWVPLGRALQSDIERLRAAPLADGAALAQRLDALLRQIDAWPLLSEPLLAHQAERAAPVAVNAEPSAALATVADAAAAVPVPAAAEPAPAAAAEAVPGAAPAPDTVPETSLWQQARAWLGQTFAASAAWVWQQVRQSNVDLVRISRIDAPEAALLAPGQAWFLRENLRLKLLSARLGLMARQFDAARADLSAVQALLERYFDPKAAATQAARKTLAQLQADLQHTELPRPDDTLAALQLAAGAR